MAQLNFKGNFKSLVIVCLLKKKKADCGLIIERLFFVRRIFAQRKSNIAGTSVYNNEQRKTKWFDLSNSNIYACITIFDCEAFEEREKYDRRNHLWADIEFEIIWPHVQYTYIECESTCVVEVWSIVSEPCFLDWLSSHRRSHYYFMKYLFNVVWVENNVLYVVQGLDFLFFLMRWIRIKPECLKI